MKVASWNVNSVRVRMPHILEWLKKAKPDILALQETKVTDDLFPKEEIEAAGYQVRFCGQPRNNGVAILSKTHSPQSICTEVAGMDCEQKRVMAATIGQVRVINLYVVNGKEVESEYYKIKLDWLDAITNFIKEELKKHQYLIVLGDFNIAPEDVDVYAPEQWRGRILCSDPERKKLQALLALGMFDTFRTQHPNKQGQYSWWDYRRAGFQNNHGLRIDLILASRGLQQHCIQTQIDLDPRAWERPSDHAPVLAEFSKVSE